MNARSAPDQRHEILCRSRSAIGYYQPKPLSVLPKLEPQSIGLDESMDPHVSVVTDD